MDVLLFQVNLGPVSKVPIPGRREMNDAVPVLHDLHVSKINSVINHCYPEFTVVMDGTPVFAEAECVVLRFVHRTSHKIKELVVHLGLYSESLDGITIAAHVSDVLTDRLSLNLRHWKAISIDRASTNKKAMDILQESTALIPFRAYCVSHGTAGCGKQATMEVGAKAVKYLSSMVKFNLCKARNLFTRIFGERARKCSGVRWGVFHELCEQVNRLGLDRLRDEYAIICLEKKWSEKSAKKFLDVIADHQAFCITSVEVAAVVDVGHSLVSETYICESKECGAFTVWHGITKLQTLFSRGIESFDSHGSFIELEKRAREAAKIMDENYVVSVHDYCSFLFCGARSMIL